MGVYLVGASTYYLGEGSCWPAVFTELAEALVNVGIDAEVRVPTYVRRPRGSGYEFEEKLIPSMTGFSALCSAELSAGDADVFDWSLLVPFDFEGVLELQVPSSYSRTTSVRSAQRMIPVAQRLGDLVELPASLPTCCDNLQLTGYFMDLEEGQHPTKPAGRWLEDQATAFYTALYLRAAEHSLKLNCPMFYT